ncbi:MAG TPA: isochorismatase family protein [Anaerolineales bacterium]|nr:isochorismatase family protein [Anaerolineales bacterium]
MRKKERYFTDPSIEQQARDIYRQVEELAQKERFLYRPHQSALLVLDMQEYFLNPESHAYVPSAEAIVQGILQLIDEFSAHDLPVIFTQHTNTERDAGMMSTWWKEVLTAQNHYHRIITTIDTSKGTLIQKSQYDAFYRTELDELLREAGVLQLVLCGVMTHLCCETTARSAFMHGYEVFFPVDGTATYNVAFHKASILNLAHGFASIVFVKDVLVALQGVHEG